VTPCAGEKDRRWERKKVRSWEVGKVGRWEGGKDRSWEVEKLIVDSSWFWMVKTINFGSCI
jgi:hypothetical protein